MENNFKVINSIKSYFNIFLYIAKKNELKFDSDFMFFFYHLISGITRGLTIKQGTVIKIYKKKRQSLVIIAFILKFFLTA